MASFSLLQATAAARSVRRWTVRSSRMKRALRSRARRCLGVLVLGIALLAPLGGCPIDANAVFVEAVRAVLTTATDSLVTSLGNYLSDDASGSGTGGN